MAGENEEHVVTPTPTPPTTRTEEPIDPAEFQRTREALAKANKEAEASRKRLRELEEAEETRKSGELSELERTKKAAAAAAQAKADAEAKAAAAERALIDTRIDHSIERVAAQLNIEYPAHVPKLVKRDKIGYDADTGEVDRNSVQKEVERLIKDCPNLVKAPHGRGSTTEAGRGHRAPRARRWETKTWLKSSRQERRSSRRCSPATRCASRRSRWERTSRPGMHAT
jgi:rRNA maturation endonuclease Nob1